MSTICSLPNGRLVIAVKGAPETIRGMLSHVPEAYDETYKYYTRRGSRVLALGFREMDNLSTDKVGVVLILLENRGLMCVGRSTNFRETRSRAL